MSRPLIEDVVIISDSLSDRGLLAEDALLGLVPMERVSGLSDISLSHRFTNGFVWSDYFASYFGTDSGFKHINLDNPLRVTTESGETLVRTFCEGGITAHDYSSRLTLNVVEAAKQQILNSLSGLRKRLFEDDEKIGTTKSIKEKTLVVEWSGANDLLTLNSEPTMQAAEDAVIARIENVKKMIAKGYRHFALMTLPDLSLVPRYQEKSDSERNVIRKVVEGFNERLIEEVKKLEAQNTQCTFMVHDTNLLFTDAFENPEKYGLEKAKRSVPFTKSPGFRLGAPATGYMFNDDVHPTTKVHEQLAISFYQAVKARYLLNAPHETLMQVYREHYGAKLGEDKAGCARFFRTSRIEHTSETLNVEGVMRHALLNKGGRTRDVLIKLGWIDSKNNLACKNPVISGAFSRLKDELDVLSARKCSIC